jgi:hypothetical protein
MPRAVPTKFIVVLTAIRATSPRAPATGMGLKIRFVSDYLAKFEPELRIRFVRDYFTEFITADDNSILGEYALELNKAIVE